MLLAEQLVGEARERRAKGMDSRERTVLAVSAAIFLVVAVTFARLLPDDRTASPLLVAGLVAGYPFLARVRFEFGGYYGTAEELAFVPMALLAPLPYVPLLIGVCEVLATLPDVVRGGWHGERAVGALADSWFSVAPVLVLAALGPGAPDLDLIGIYGLAFGAQVTGDLAWTMIRDRLLDQLPLREVVRNWFGTVRVDAVLAPMAVMVAISAETAPLALLAIGPLAWLLLSFSRDRQERYAAALELNRAYRGTVMLLSDVVEFDDPYTGSHSRSIVELVNAVADKLGVDQASRQELEFAALLHDVGKISIPKEILNKPAKLTDHEFELMKTHTIEGQFMLDRVGGLLSRVGEVVRSCHERWDGKGYPDGLAGEDIPLAARIVHCCDAYHAMTSDRIYRAAMSQEEAFAELAAGTGTQFDPTVVVALTEVLQQVEPALPAIDEVRAVLARRVAADGLRAAS